MKCVLWVRLSVFVVVLVLCLVISMFRCLLMVVCLVFWGLSGDFGSLGRCLGSMKVSWLFDRFSV